MPVSLAGLDYCGHHPDNGCIVHEEGLTNSFGDEVTLAALPLHLPLQRHKAFARAISLLAPTEKHLIPLVEHAGHHGVTATHAGSFLDTPSAALLSEDQVISDQTSTQQHDSPLHVNGQGHGLGSAFLGDEKIEYVSEPYVDGANSGDAWAASLRNYKPLPNKLSKTLSKDAPENLPGDAGDSSQEKPTEGGGHKCISTSPQGWVYPSSSKKKVCCCANINPKKAKMDTMEWSETDVKAARAWKEKNYGKTDANKKTWKMDPSWELEDTEYLGKEDCNCNNWTGNDGKKAGSKNDPNGLRFFSYRGLLIDTGDGCQCEFDSVAKKKIKESWLAANPDKKAADFKADWF